MQTDSNGCRSSCPRVFATVVSCGMCHSCLAKNFVWDSLVCMDQNETSGVKTTDNVRRNNIQRYHWNRGELDRWTSG